MDWTTQRRVVISEIAEKILRIKLPHPVRVGIDGGSASGKTVFADQLAELVREKGREVIRAGIDGFHNPPEIRHRQGPLSVDGSVEDSFDYRGVREHVLNPLGRGGSREYRHTIFDHKAGRSDFAATLVAPDDAVLIFEGVMLFNREIVEGFDFKVSIEVPEEVCLERAKVRDLGHFGSIDTLLEKYHSRFFPGQALHRERHRPSEAADVVVCNKDHRAPALRWNSRHHQARHT
jgi:uridine kinase